MKSHFYRVPLQLELPLNPQEPTDDELRAKWAAARARLKAYKQMDLLHRSRVEYEQRPN